MCNIYTIQIHHSDFYQHYMRLERNIHKHEWPSTLGHCNNNNNNNNNNNSTINNNNNNNLGSILCSIHKMVSL